MTFFTNLYSTHMLAMGALLLQSPRQSLSDGSLDVPPVPQLEVAVRILRPKVTTT